MVHCTEQRHGLNQLMKVQGNKDISVYKVKYLLQKSRLCGGFRSGLPGSGKNNMKKKKKKKSQVRKNIWELCDWVREMWKGL